MSRPALAARRQPRDSLATKIIFFVFLSTFLTALVVSWISIHSTYTFLHRSIDESYPGLLSQTVRSLGRRLVEQRTQAGELASRLGALPSDPRGEPNAETRAAGRALLDHAEKALGLASVLWLGPHGQRIASAGAPNSVPDSLQKTLGRVEAPRLRALDAHDTPAAVLAPVHGPNGRDWGVLVALIRRADLAVDLRSDLLGGHSDLYLVDAHGHAITGGHDVHASRIQAFPASLLDGGSGTAVREFWIDDGRRAIGSARPLGLLDWSVVVEQPFEEAFAPVFSVVTRVFVIDLAIILLFSFFAYEVTSAIVRPIEALSEGARRISQGELDVEIPDARTHDEIGLLTRTFNDMTRRLRKNRAEISVAYQRLQEQNDELQRANEVLEQLSITDGLTRLHNHRYFQDHLTREIKRVSRTQEPLSILLIDIDDFKQLNDRFGHAAGDELLVRIARILNESVRETDLLARYGGEEFVVLATGTDLNGATSLAEKVRTAVAESSFILEDSMRLTKVTISIGVAVYDGSRKDFFQAADRALYRAKADGKNCVVAAES